ncbi:hypothetical protein LCGC14_1472350 [marine sediment metagenome]|uniref:Zinc-ribbon domain-containing protein n=1 Tax=marine sediment metagenome TaxID=412755 RepID=A0A0F9JBZ3_9ZZZZ
MSGYWSCPECKRIVWVADNFCSWCGIPIHHPAKHLGMFDQPDTKPNKIASLKPQRDA